MSGDTGAEIAAAIDWSVFDRVRQTLHCGCGGRWRSNAKARTVRGMLVLVSQNPCPDCGSHLDVRRSEGDRVEWSVVGIDESSRLRP